MFLILRIPTALTTMTLATVTALLIDGQDARHDSLADCCRNGPLLYPAANRYGRPVGKTDDPALPDSECAAACLTLTAARSGMTA
jgi:hypothetical protein